ncbi:MAG: DUF4157 domain-containing protein [Paracoccaceae bacterium]|nr:DUF4157 domain-containing protein [Paracoccaceae bacterium]
MAQIFASERGRKPQKSAQPEGRSVKGSNLNGLQNRADASASQNHLATLQCAADTVQRMEEDEMLQGKAKGDVLSSDPVQRMEDEELLQGKAKMSKLASEQPVQRQADPGSGNGLPSALQAGVENLSGVDMSSVQVHYNSAKPSQLQAHAYAQGSAIHLGPGQEHHLPHEAWHVAQQAQGRVKPTTQLAGQQINDDAGLEGEADRMGARAMREGNAVVPD